MPLSFVKSSLLALSFSSVLVYAGPSWRRTDFSGRSVDQDQQLQERGDTCTHCKLNILDFTNQLKAGKPYVRFELADTAGRAAPNVPIVFDVKNCGDTALDNNVVQAHERVDNIAGALRKCQSFVLQPQLQIQNNTFGIHTSDWLTGWGLVTQPGDSRAVSITSTDPLWQEDQQYQIQCFQPAGKVIDPTAKDAQGRKYFGKQCLIKVVGTGKCLAAMGYNQKKDSNNYDLGQVDCAPKIDDPQSTWNIQNVASCFTQDNHDMSVAVKDIAKPPDGC